jgi:hypothetical protein
MALYGLLAILVAGVLFLSAAYLLPAGEQIAPPIRDEPIWDLPAEKRLDHVDVASVRLPVALRGYRFAETDLLLDRLADELRSRDEEIARLRAAVAAGSGDSAGSDDSSRAGDSTGQADLSPEADETWLAPDPAERVEPRSTPIQPNDD